MARGGKNESTGPASTEVRELAGAFADALLIGNEIDAEIAVGEAMQLGLTTAEIGERLVAPAMWLVGEWWERGRISVADEHRATEITTRVMALQREAVRVTASRSERLVMLATTAGEQHLLALRLVETLLREAGYRVVMLGADIPAGALAQAALRHQPGVICLSATMPGRRNELLWAIDAMRESWPSSAFLLGGRGVTQEARLRSEVQACVGVSEAAEAVDAIVRRWSLN